MLQHLEVQVSQMYFEETAVLAELLCIVIFAKEQDTQNKDAIVYMDIHPMSNSQRERMVSLQQMHVLLRLMEVNVKRILG